MLHCLTNNFEFQLLRGALFNSFSCSFQDCLYTLCLARAYHTDIFLEGQKLMTLRPQCLHKHVNDASFDNAATKTSFAVVASCVQEFVEGCIRSAAVGGGLVLLEALYAGSLIIVLVPIPYTRQPLQTSHCVLMYTVANADRSLNLATHLVQTDTSLCWHSFFCCRCRKQLNNCLC